MLASTLDPGFLDRRVVVTYSPNGRHVVLIDFNRGSGTASVDIFVALAGGGVAAGTQIMGSGTVPSFSAFLPNLSFVAQWNQTEFAGLNFDVIAAVLVGGTALQGGEGSTLRSALGAVFIALLANFLLLRDTTFGIRTLVTGLIVVVATAAFHLLRTRGRRL